MVGILSRLILLLVVAAMCSRSEAQEIALRTMRTEHFIIYYAPGAEATAKKAGEIGERWHGILSKKLKLEPGGITPMYLYPDRRSFSAATGYRPDESIVGTAHTRTLAVRVDASHTFARIENVIPHELAHVFISRRLGISVGRLPLYMHEGLAKYLTDDWSTADAELLRDIGSSGRIIPLSRITFDFPEDREERAVAYVEGYSVVRYMAKKYSPDSIPDLLSEIKAGRLFPTALEYSIGTTPENLEREWRDYLWDEYGLDRWIRLASAAVSVLMAVFGILAFRARWIRKRRKAAELEADWRGRNLDYGQDQ